MMYNVRGELKRDLKVMTIDIKRTSLSQRNLQRPNIPSDFKIREAD